MGRFEILEERMYKFLLCLREKTRREERKGSGGWGSLGGVSEWCIERFMERSVEQTMEQSVERPIEQTIEQSVERSIEQSMEPISIPLFIPPFNL